MVQTFKQLVKITISYLLFASGYLAYYRKRQLKNTLVVLMYHRVLKTSELAHSFSSRGIIVSNGTFDSHMRYLKKHFNVLSIDEFIAHLTDNIPLPDSSCLITFDDGWIDNYTNAFPILTNYNLPALIFLPTNFMGSRQPFWQETLSSYIHQLADGARQHREFLEQQGVLSFGSLAVNEKKQTVTKYITSLKQQSNEKIDTVVDAFKNYTGRHNIQQKPENIDRYIDWEQARMMEKQGISFGSHAMSHRLLTKLDQKEAEYELAESKNIIASQLNTKVHSVAYPNGDFNDSVVDNARNCGYFAGFTTKRGYFRVGNDPHKIKRINIHQAATGKIPMFLCQLLGIF